MLTEQGIHDILSAIKEGITIIVFLIDKMSENNLKCNSKIDPFRNEGNYHIKVTLLYQIFNGL